MFCLTSGSNVSDLQVALPLIIAHLFLDLALQLYPDSSG